MISTDRAVRAAASLRGLITLVVSGELVANSLDVDCTSGANLSRTNVTLSAMLNESDRYLTRTLRSWC
jgi:hypothetical protein